MSGGREEKTETQPACKICRNEEYMKKQSKGVPTTITTTAFIPAGRIGA